jgi:CheY-like chemotaxis protein
MGPRILFVDDSDVARAVTSRELAHRGALVTALGSLREVATVEPAAFAAALLDLELGDGYGPDLAARLREASPDLPIAFLTAEEGSSVLVDAARAIGPVFRKITDVDEAIGWVLAAAGG